MRDPFLISETRLADWIRPRRRLILLAMLVVLHLALIEGLESAMGSILMVADIGLFFLWQPFVRAEQRLSVWHLAMVLGAVGVVVFLQSKVLMVVWVMLLAGIIGGKVFALGSRWSRVFHLAALTYLVAALLIFLLPQLLPTRSPGDVILEGLLRFGAPVLFVAMVATPGESLEQDRPELIDFTYSVFIFLLLAVLALGSLAGILLTGYGYVQSLLVVLGSMAGVLLFLGWAWNPRAGFAGVGVAVSRHLLSASLPFEAWVEALASYVDDDAGPDEFVTWGCNRLLSDLGWIDGMRWSADSGAGEAGRLDGHATRFERYPLTFVVHSGQPLAPTVSWYLGVLLQLLSEFYLARLRERQLRELGYLQAIYQTGSRLTHDVKNILQSLSALCTAAAAEGPAASPEFHGLIRRQLPAIAARLRQTIDKLARPAVDGLALAEAEGWWLDIQNQFSGRGIEFSAEGILAGRMLPTGLFSTAAENLLQNALDKRQLNPSLAITARLTVDEAGAILEVCDDGAAIREGLARQLGVAPVKSANGLGIGLYQVARLGAPAGYRLEVVENRPGRVCLRLVPGAADLAIQA
jgi:hypothetical protein